MYKLSKYVWHPLVKSRPFCREDLFSPKKPKNSHFFVKNIGLTSLWEDLEVKLLTPGQLLGHPWKLWGSDCLIWFFYHYTSKLFSISSAWWAFQLNDLHRETNDCWEEEGREHSAGLEGTAVIMLIAHNIFINIQHSHIFIIFHSYIFHTFSYFFIHFHIMEGTVVIICIAHNIFINIQQSHFYRCSCRPWKVLHNPEAVPKCGYFAPQWNVNNSSFMFLCFFRVLRYLRVHCAKSDEVYQS